MEPPLACSFDVEKISQQFPRPPVYRAPSWSWAAIDGCVGHVKQSEPVDPELSILSHAIQLAKPAAPFAAVLSGNLNLKGCLKPAFWNGDLLFSATSPYPRYLASTVADSLASELFNERTDLVRVWCLQIHLFDKLRHMGPSGLILALHKRVDKFSDAWQLSLSKTSNQRIEMLPFTLNSMSSVENGLCHPHWKISLLFSAFHYRKFMLAVHLTSHYRKGRVKVCSQS
jgi:hypothetical protein